MLDLDRAQRAGEKIADCIWFPILFTAACAVWLVMFGSKCFTLNAEYEDGTMRKVTLHSLICRGH